MSSFKKTDKYGETINPGDICIYDGILVIYKHSSWGGKGSKGEYGRFISPSGDVTVKFTSVVFAFDPLGKRRNNSTVIKELTRKFYEGDKK